MKIAIFSDCHCGYDYGEERGEDAFIALSEAMEKSSDCDLILIAGDIFDSRTPKQEVLAKTARILSSAKSSAGRAKFIEILNKEKHEVSPLAVRGIPIVAIHGTHERRSKQMVNPVQALEHAGLVIHLHCATAVFEINGKEVAVHGMSGVPERYASDVLREWNPKPIENAVNIFMMHQSIEPYIYSPLDPPSLSLADLPDGFDLYVLGHIHWSEIRDFKSGKLLVAGSLIPTSIHKIESEQKKSIFIFDGSLESVPLKKQRKVYIEEFSCSEDVADNIGKRISEILSQEHEMKPIINIKITGKVPAGWGLPLLNRIKQKFSDRSILKITHNAKPENLEEQIELMKMMREHRMSVEEQGIALLRKNMEQLKCGINIDEIFEPLAAGNVDILYNILSGRQKTLKEC